MSGDVERNTVRSNISYRNLGYKTLIVWVHEKTNTANHS